MTEQLVSQFEQLAAQYLNIQESAAYLGISCRAVDRLVERGTLKKLMFKGKPFIPLGELEYYKLRKQQRRRQLSMYARENLFEGVNPLLMSLLQTPVGADKSMYPAFHAAHITHITDFLNTQLPPKYRAMGLQSIQIQRVDDDTFMPDSDFIPDAAIFEQDSSVSPVESTPSNMFADAPVLVMPLAETLPPDKTLMGVGIFRTGTHRELGEPIVRIELLSPANKPPNAYAKAYVENRLKCFAAGTDLIEIDYLHETKSPVRGVPSYPEHPDAQPYSIILNRPKLDVVEVYAFGISDPVPTLRIPLGGEDAIAFDFNQVYQHTFVVGRWGKLPSIDYQQEPMRMQTYSPNDRAIIRSQLQIIREQHRGPTLRDETPD